MTNDIGKQINGHTSPPHTVSGHYIDEMNRFRIVVLLGLTLLSCQEELYNVHDGKSYVKYRGIPKKGYPLLVKQEFKDFSNQGPDYQILKGILLKADKLRFKKQVNQDIYGQSVKLSQFELDNRMKIPRTRCIGMRPQTINFIDRILLLDLMIVDDKDKEILSLMLKDQIRYEMNYEERLHWMIKLGKCNLNKSREETEPLVIIRELKEDRDTKGAEFWMDGKYIVVKLSDDERRMEQARKMKLKEWEELSDEDLLFDINHIDEEGVICYAISQWDEKVRNNSIGGIGLVGNNSSNSIICEDQLELLKEDKIDEILVDSILRNDR